MKPCAPDLPILDRVKFLAITGSNLDEFFQVRTGGLHTLHASAPTVRDISGMDVGAQLSAIEKRVRRFKKDQERLFQKELLPSLANAGLPLHTMADLTPEQVENLSRYYESSIEPLLSPLILTAENSREMYPLSQHLSRPLDPRPKNIGIPDCHRPSSTRSPQNRTSQRRRLRSSRKSRGSLLLLSFPR